MKKIDIVLLDDDRKAVWYLGDQKTCLWGNNWTVHSMCSLNQSGLTSGRHIHTQLYCATRLTKRNRHYLQLDTKYSENIHIYCVSVWKYAYMNICIFIYSLDDLLQGSSLWSYLAWQIPNPLFQAGNSRAEADPAVYQVEFLLFQWNFSLVFVFFFPEIFQLIGSEPI